MFPVFYAGIDAAEVMPCTYTAVVLLSYAVYSQVIVYVSFALSNHQAQNTKYHTVSVIKGGGSRGRSQQKRAGKGTCEGPS